MTILVSSDEIRKRKHPVNEAQREKVLEEIRNSLDGQIKTRPSKRGNSIYSQRIAKEIADRAYKSKRVLTIQDLKKWSDSVEFVPDSSIGPIVSGVTRSTFTVPSTRKSFFGVHAYKKK